MDLTRLASRDNFRQVEQNWQLEFIYYVLETIGIPEELLAKCFPEDGNLTIDHKIELRKHLDKFSVVIVDDSDGGLKIYFEQELMAEWKKCKFVLREDIKEINPSKRLYIEIQADIWVIFDQGENQ